MRERNGTGEGCKGSRSGFVDRIHEHLLYQDASECPFLPRPVLDRNMLLSPSPCSVTFSSFLRPPPPPSSHSSARLPVPVHLPQNKNQTPPPPERQTRKRKITRFIASPPPLIDRRHGLPGSTTPPRRLQCTTCPSRGLWSGKRSSWCRCRCRRRRLRCRYRKN